MPYHLNKETGVASLCRATHGKCPFGEQAHYATWEEAQEQADIMLANAYQTLPSEQTREAIIKNIKDSQSKYVERGNISYSDLLLTKDTDLLRAVLQGEIMYTNDLRLVEAVYSNKNCPTSLVNAVANEIDKYPMQFQVLAARSPGANENVLFNLAYNTPYPEVEKATMMNPKLSRETIEEILEPILRGKTPGAPHIYAAWNPNCPPHLRELVASYCKSQTKKDL